jgi:hypothetical protein
MLVTWRAFFAFGVGRVGQLILRSGHQSRTAPRTLQNSPEFSVSNTRITSPAPGPSRRRRLSQLRPCGAYIGVSRVTGDATFAASMLCTVGVSPRARLVDD